MHNIAESEQEKRNPERWTLNCVGMTILARYKEIFNNAYKPENTIGKGGNYQKGSHENWENIDWLYPSSSRWEIRFSQKSRTNNQGPCRLAVTWWSWKIEDIPTPAQMGGEIGECWDIHDLTEYRDQTQRAEFEVDIQFEITYYALVRQLSERIQAIAKKRGVSPNTLLNLLVQVRTGEIVKRGNLYPKTAIKANI